MLSWEKPVVKPMAPGSIFYHISFQSTFICIFNFPIYIIKYQKYINLSYYLYQISLSQVALKGLTTPLLCWLRVLICLCRCVGLLRSLLLDWYLGSQKLREILTLLCYITLSSSREKTNASSRSSRKSFWHHCRGDLRQVKTYQVPIINSHLSHYIILPFASRFPLPHFTLAILFVHSFPIFSLFRLPFCLLVCSIACCDGAR